MKTYRKSSRFDKLVFIKRYEKWRNTGVDQECNLEGFHYKGFRWVKTGKIWRELQTMGMVPTIHHYWWVDVSSPRETHAISPNRVVNRVLARQLQKLKCFERLYQEQMAFKNNKRLEFWSSIIHKNHRDFNSNKRGPSEPSEHGVHVLASHNQRKPIAIALRTNNIVSGSQTMSSLVDHKC